ncbi:VanZ family protein [Glutamicibacter sp.]|uniref:VanZ family protein n=1 Tax=Glutamicibacter sp. TaxID=1931995 RepID=UPI0028BF39A0|nr:VanZ family protein [Glutamicibacter sp.]
MNSVTWPGAIAILGCILFLGVAGVFLLAVQYRRHGRLSWRRTITTTAATLYGFGLFSYTMLPLPDSQNFVCQPTQLNPGHFVGDFARAYEYGTRSFLTGFTLWQVLFNIILFMPLGILAVRWLRGNVFTGVLLGFAASLAIELTQYTGMWGLYHCAYRVADVDDLIMNTLGALIGGIIAYLPIFAFLSGPREPRAINAPARPVTRRRRALADFFDSSFAGAAVFAVSAGLQLIATMGGPQIEDRLLNFALPAVVALAVFFIPAIAPGRATLGQRCAWIRISSTQRKYVPSWRAGLRTILGFGGITFLFQISTSLNDELDMPWVGTFTMLYALISALCLVVIPKTRGLAGILTVTSFTDRRSS